MHPYWKCNNCGRVQLGNKACECQLPIEHYIPDSKLYSVDEITAKLAGITLEELRKIQEKTLGGKTR